MLLLWNVTWCWLITPTACLWQIDDDKRKDSTYFRHRGRYDKKVQTTKNLAGITKKLASFCFTGLICFLRILQPVILKELKQMEGDFNENQKIELNTVRLKTVGIVVSIQTETRLFLNFAPAALAYKTSVLSNTSQNCSFSFFWPSNLKWIPSSYFIRQSSVIYSTIKHIRIVFLYYV